MEIPQPKNPTLNPEEHGRLVDKYTELLGNLEYLKQQRDLSDETAHTEELMSGDEINEKFIDRGWTAQINEAEQEISEIETRIANLVSSIRPLSSSQKELNLD